MEFVIKNQLKGANRYSELLLFVVGINSHLRISDRLPLRVGDFFNDAGKMLFEKHGVSWQRGCMVGYRGNNSGCSMHFLLVTQTYRLEAIVV